MPCINKYGTSMELPYIPLTGEGWQARKQFCIMTQQFFSVEMWSCPSSPRRRYPAANWAVLATAVRGKREQIFPSIWNLWDCCRSTVQFRAPQCKKEQRKDTNVVKGLNNNIQGKAELYALVQSEEDKTKGRAFGSLQLPKRKLQKTKAKWFIECHHKEGTEVSTHHDTLEQCVFSSEQISTASYKCTRNSFFTPTG